MTDDLIARLRAMSETCCAGGCDACSTETEAADRIEALTAEREADKARIAELEDTVRVAAKWFEAAAINHEIAAEAAGPRENAAYVEAARRDTFRANTLRAALEGTSDE